MTNLVGGLGGAVLLASLPVFDRAICILYKRLAKISKVSWQSVKSLNSALYAYTAYVSSLHFRSGGKHTALDLQIKKASDKNAAPKETYRSEKVYSNSNCRCKDHDESDSSGKFLWNAAMILNIPHTCTSAECTARAEVWQATCEAVACLESYSSVRWSPKCHYTGLQPCERSAHIITRLGLAPSLSSIVSVRYLPGDPLAFEAHVLRLDSLGRLVSRPKPAAPPVVAPRSRGALAASEPSAWEGTEGTAEGPEPEDRSDPKEIAGKTEVVA